MQEKLQALQQEALQKVTDAADLKALNDVRVAYLGKKGPITEVLRGMGRLSAEESPKLGALANEVRAAIASAIEEKQAALRRRGRESAAWRLKRLMLPFLVLLLKKAIIIRLTKITEAN